MVGVFWIRLEVGNRSPLSEGEDQGFLSDSLLNLETCHGSLVRFDIGVCGGPGHVGQ